MKENINVTHFPNGLIVLTEPMPDVRSATIGFWLRKGSRHEPAHLNGILHFIEHTVFKGTPKRTAFDIAVETDRLGGNLEAFTMQDMTGFIAKVIDTETENAFDLIADMLTNSLFDEEELRREQKVIIEEIKMVEDTPEDFLSELFTKGFFPSHPLGLPIEGTRKTVRTFNHKVTAEFHSLMYQPKNIVITAAGNVKHNEIVKMARKTFGGMQPKKHIYRSSKPATAVPFILKNNPNLEQAHFMIGTPWIKTSDPRRYAANILVSILGDGNASRLWQSIREERGLAYSVGATESSFEECGIFNIYAACSPDKMREVIDLSIAEMRRIKNEGVTEKELRLAKDQMIASRLLGLEDSSVRASTLARQEIYYGKLVPTDEILQNVEKVTASDIKKLTNTFFKNGNVSFAAVGNFKSTKIKRDDLTV